MRKDNLKEYLDTNRKHTKDIEEIDRLDRELTRLASRGLKFKKEMVLHKKRTEPFNRALKDYQETCRKANEIEKQIKALR